MSEPGSGVRLHDRYVLEAHVGSGGVGEVWRAKDLRTGGSVAIKFLRDLDGAQRNRFAREVEILVGLSHPNIVRVSDYAPEEEPPWLAMTFVQGGTLADVRGAQPTATVRRYLLEILRALDAAHRRSIVHRDLKPSNVLVSEDGWCAVADFGLSRTAGISDLTSAGTSVGTPEYWSPEQARGLAAAPDDDIYSAGVIAFELATGRLPFPVPSDGDRLRASYVRIGSRAPTVASVAPALDRDDPALSRLIDSMLARTPASRPTASVAISRLEAQRATCRACGAFIAPEDRFCGTCGAPATTPPGRYEPPASFGGAGGSSWSPTPPSAPRALDPPPDGPTRRRRRPGSFSGLMAVILVLPAGIATAAFLARRGGSGTKTIELAPLMAPVAPPYRCVSPWRRDDPAEMKLVLGYPDGHRVTYESVNDTDRSKAFIVCGGSRNRPGLASAPLRFVDDGSVASGPSIVRISGLFGRDRSGGGASASRLVTLDVLAKGRRLCRLATDPIGDARQFSCSFPTGTSIDAIALRLHVAKDLPTGVFVGFAELRATVSGRG